MVLIGILLECFQMDSQLLFSEYMTWEWPKFFTLTFKACWCNREVHFKAMPVLNLPCILDLYSIRKKMSPQIWHLIRKNTDDLIQWNLFYFKDYRVRWKRLIRLAFHNDFSLLLNLWHLLPHLCYQATAEKLNLCEWRKFSA